MEDLKLYFTDIRGVLANAFDRAFSRWLCRFSTIYIRWVMMIRGVSHGKRCRFWGRMYFRRTRYSKIVLGNDCRFRSTLSANLVGVNHRCVISTHTKQARIEIGDFVGMSGTVVAAAESITIGHRVGCGANTTITDFDWHPISKKLGLPAYGKSAPIRIEDNVWLGLNVLVLKGVTIGKNTVIAANSVVTKSLPANVLAGGVPCRIIKTIERY